MEYSAVIAYRLSVREADNKPSPVAFNKYREWGTAYAVFVRRRGRRYRNNRLLSLYAGDKLQAHFHLAGYDRVF
jgi:hypothetical protein